MIPPYHEALMKDGYTTMLDYRTPPQNTNNESTGVRNNRKRSIALLNP